MADKDKTENDSPQKQAKREMHNVARELAKKAKAAQKLGDDIVAVDDQLNKNAQSLQKLVEEYRSKRPEGYPDIPLSDLGQLATTSTTTTDMADTDSTSTSNESDTSSSLFNAAADTSQSSDPDSSSSTYLE